MNYSEFTRLIRKEYWLQLKWLTLQKEAGRGLDLEKKMVRQMSEVVLVNWFCR